MSKVVCFLFCLIDNLIDLVKEDDVEGVALALASGSDVNQRDAVCVSFSKLIIFHLFVSC